jgi:hypothetical protein
MKKLFCVLFFITTAAFAQDEAAPPATSGASFQRTNTYLTLGWTIAPKHSTSGSFNGKDIATSNGSDDSGPSVSIDQIYRISPNFGASAVLEYTKSPSKNGPSDDLFFLGIGPRGALPLGNFELWSSALVGLGADFFGSTKQNFGNNLMVLSNDKSLGFEFSPRIGVDYSLNQSAKIRLQISYSMVTFATSFDEYRTPGLTYIGSGSETSDVTWLTAAIGFAWGF